MHSSAPGVVKAELDRLIRDFFRAVSFEPGGKDHSTAGGSFDTAKDIVREVYGWQAPEYVGYDFVRIKGRAGKISSSKGDVVIGSDVWVGTEAVKNRVLQPGETGFRQVGACQRALVPGPRPRTLAASPWPL